MITRFTLDTLERAMREFPAVALLGPRQVGKTTLALAWRERNSGADYLDLEDPGDAAVLEEPLAYLQGRDGPVILDEIQRRPDLFPVLRSLIDRHRREGHGNGRYLLLGSATNDLLRQSGESLAGRIAYLELGGLAAGEVLSAPEWAGDERTAALDRLWLRGGFPRSWLATDDAASLRWRQQFLRTYLERDIPQLGPRIPAETLRRFWTMLAHAQGGLWNAEAMARSLGVTGKTALHYLDVLVDLMLVRRLPPLHVNVGKRLTRSPKVYVRDPGVVHALLGIRSLDELLGHPVVGGSWEGFVLEQLLDAVSPMEATASFYRTQAGAEMDLVLEGAGGRCWTVEIKRAHHPKRNRGFWNALSDIAPQRAFVAYPGTRTQVLEGPGVRVEVLPWWALAERLREEWA
jgi:predicted AAA+ superfamily ATPase